MAMNLCSLSVLLPDFALRHHRMRTVTLLRGFSPGTFTCHIHYRIGSTYALSLQIIIMQSVTFRTSFCLHEKKAKNLEQT